MNGYNSHYFNRNLLSAITKSIAEDVLRLDQGNIDPERKRRLQQAQAAANLAEKDPETGLMKVSGAIQGVPKTQPGGDLYGVDPEGRAFVVTSKKRTAPTETSTPSTPSAPSTSMSSSSSALSKPASITRNWGTGSTSPVPNIGSSARPIDIAKSKFDVKTMTTPALEADSRRRIRKAEALATFTPGFGAGKGQGETNIVPLQASDIRPQGMDRGGQQRIAPPRAQTPISNILPNIIPPKGPLNPNAPSMQSVKGSSLSVPALERIRADEMDPRIQRQKDRVAAERAARARQAYRNPAQGTSLLRP
jgi:hypothetical protein